MIKGIAFDEEGTVINVEGVHHSAHVKVMNEVGLDWNLNRAYTEIKHFIGGPDEVIYKEVFELLSPAQQAKTSVAAMLARKGEMYDRVLPSLKISARPGFLKFHRDVRARGYKTAIGSLTATKNALHLLKVSGLFDEFEPSCMVFKESVARLKPAPDVFIETSKRMNVHPSDQLVFEDSPRGVQAALAAGSIAVGMPVIHNGVAVGALVDAGVKSIFFDWREINIEGLINNMNALIAEG